MNGTLQDVKVAFYRSSQLIELVVTNISLSPFIPHVFMRVIKAKLSV